MTSPSGAIGAMLAVNRNHPLTALRRTGVVNSITPPTVGVFVGGDTSTEVPCAFVDEYTPVIGDIVLLLVNKGDYVVVGTLNHPSPIQSSRLIIAHKTNNSSILDSIWTEVRGFDTVDYGGDAALGQISRDVNNSLLIPVDGFYEIIVHAHYSAPGSGVSWIRALCATAVAGLAAPPGGLPTWNAQTVSGNNTLQIASTPFPQFYNAGDSVSGYLWSQISSGGATTIVPNFLWISGRQVA